MNGNESIQAFSTSERRISDRKKLVIDVSYNGGDATGIANTKDIGVGGLYMTTSKNLDPGTLIFMRMMVGGRDISLSGVVVYTDPGLGVGVRFHNLNDDDQIFLKNELGLE